MSSKNPQTVTSQIKWPVSFIGLLTAFPGAWGKKWRLLAGQRVKQEKPGGWCADTDGSFSQWGSVTHHLEDGWRASLQELGSVYCHCCSFYCLTALDLHIKHFSSIPFLPSTHALPLPPAPFFPTSPLPLSICVWPTEFKQFLECGWEQGQRIRCHTTEQNGIPPLIYEGSAFY